MIDGRTVDMPAGDRSGSARLEQRSAEQAGS